MRVRSLVARGQAASGSVWWWLLVLSRSLACHLGPEERGELAAIATVTTAEGLPWAVSGVGGERADLRLARRDQAARSYFGSAWAMTIVPGGLYQQPAGVPVADVGDVPAVRCSPEAYSLAAIPSQDASSRG